MPSEYRSPTVEPTGDDAWEDAEIEPGDEEVVNNGTASRLGFQATGSADDPATDKLQEPQRNSTSADRDEKRRSNTKPTRRSPKHPKAFEDVHIGSSRSFSGYGSDRGDTETTWSDFQQDSPGSKPPNHLTSPSMLSTPTTLTDETSSSRSDESSTTVTPTMIAEENSQLTEAEQAESTTAPLPGSLDVFAFMDTDSVHRDEPSRHDPVERRSAKKKHSRYPTVQDISTTSMITSGDIRDGAEETHEGTERTTSLEQWMFENSSSSVFGGSDGSLRGFKQRRNGTRYAPSSADSEMPSSGFSVASECADSHAGPGGNARHGEKRSRRPPVSSPRRLTPRSPGVNLQQPLTPDFSNPFHQTPQTRSAHQLDVRHEPGVMPKSAYDLLAMKLALPQAERQGVKPLYRRFEALNHRLLLHLQDELCELEDELAQLDDLDTYSRTTFDEFGRPMQIMPGSRRFSRNHQLEWPRTELLRKISYKLSGYNQALSAFNATETLHRPRLGDVEKYRDYLGCMGAIVEQETHFLDNGDDLVCLRRSATARSASIGSKASTQQPPAPSTKPTELPSLRHRLLNMYSGSAARVAVVAVSLLAIKFIPLITNTLARFIVVCLVGSALLACSLQADTVRSADGLAVAIVSIGLMMVLAIMVT